MIKISTIKRLVRETEKIYPQFHRKHLIRTAIYFEESHEAGKGLNLGFKIMRGLDLIEDPR